MRILVLNHEYPPIGGGGGQITQDIALALNKRGHEIRVVTSHIAGLSRKEIQGAQPGVQVIRLPSCRQHKFKAGLGAMMGYNIVAFVTGMRQIRRWRPDLIHVHFAVPAGPVAWLLSKLTGTPYILTTHLGDIPGGAPKKTAGWFRWICPFTPPI